MKNNKKNKNKQFLILTINPGSTSTKIGVYRNEISIFETVVRHSTKKLEEYNKIWDQYSFRKDEIIDILKENHIKLKNLDAVVGRGGLLRPMRSGVYIVDEEMIQDARVGIQGEHASNLGCVIAYGIGWEYEIPSFIADPPVVDELEDIARVSGNKNIERNSIFHALNIFATARVYSKKTDNDFKKINLIIAHLGGGITVAALKNGEVINVNNGLDEGPFSPQRSGKLPLLKVLEMGFSKKYRYKELKKMIVGSGGLVSYFMSSDAELISKKAEAGIENYDLVFKAMAYQIAEEIGSRATNLKGDVKQIILTGGLAYSKYLTELISERVEFIAPVVIYPGENELEALALAGLRVLRGKEVAKKYQTNIS